MLAVWDFVFRTELGQDFFFFYVCSFQEVRVNGKLYCSIRGNEGGQGAK